jgi:hypothetical protein
LVLVLNIVGFAIILFPILYTLIIEDFIKIIKPN